MSVRFIPFPRSFMSLFLFPLHGIPFVCFPFRKLNAFFQSILFVLLCLPCFLPYASFPRCVRLMYGSCPFLSRLIDYCCPPSLMSLPLFNSCRVVLNSPYLFPPYPNLPASCWSFLPPPRIALSRTFFRFLFFVLFSFLVLPSFFSPFFVMTKKSSRI